MSKNNIAHLWQKEKINNILQYSTVDYFLNCPPWLLRFKIIVHSLILNLRPYDQKNTFFLRSKVTAQKKKKKGHIKLLLMSQGEENKGQTHVKRRWLTTYRICCCRSYGDKAPTWYISVSIMVPRNAGRKRCTRYCPFPEVK